MLTKKESASEPVPTGKGQPSGCPFPPPAQSEPAESIVEGVKRRLSVSPYGEVRRIDCQDQGDVIVLRGCVSNYFRKQVALSIAMEMAPGKKFRDEVRVNAVARQRRDQ